MLISNQHFNHSLYFSLLIFIRSLRFCEESGLILVNVEIPAKPRERECLIIWLTR